MAAEKMMVVSRKNWLAAIHYRFNVYGISTPVWSTTPVGHFNCKNERQWRLEVEYSNPSLHCAHRTTMLNRSSTKKVNPKVGVVHIGGAVLKSGHSFRSRVNNIMGVLKSQVKNSQIWDLQHVFRAPRQKKAGRYFRDITPIDLSFMGMKKAAEAPSLLCDCI